MEVDGLIQLSSSPNHSRFPPNSKHCHAWQLILDVLPQITPAFSHTQTVLLVYLQHPMEAVNTVAGLTDSHHVVPAIQQAHAELQPIGRVAHIDESQLPVRVLTDGRCPSHQEPADDEQDDAQQTQHSPAGHIGDPLGCAGEEHLQHPAGGGKMRRHQ